MRGEGATWHENQLVPIIRHGELQDVYWTYSFGPIDEPGFAHGVGGVLVICTETTEQVLAERRLSAEREKIIQLFDQAPTFLALLRGPDHVIDLANPGYRKLVGNRPVVGRKVVDALPDAVAQGYLGLLDEVYRSGKPFSANGARYAVQVFPEAPPDERYVDFVFQPVTDRNGSITGILVQGVDVTDRQRAESALKESQERYRRLFISMTEQVHHWQLERDLSGEIRAWRLIDANPATLKAWGKTLEEVQGKTADEILGPGATEHSMPVVQQIFASGDPHSLEDYFPHLDKYLSFTSVPMGESFITTGADITAIKKTALALRESEARFRQLAETLPELVWTCHADGPCDYLGPQWIAYTGVPEVPQLGYGWQAQLHPDDRDRAVAEWLAAAPVGASFDIEFRIRRFDGVYRWFRARALPLRDNSGKIVKWFGCNSDIDDIKQAEEALLAADRRKDEFLATLAHELRNPLAPIRYAAAMLRPGAPDAITEKARQTIERQAEHLTSLLNDLLDVSRITHNTITLKAETLDLKRSVQDALELARPASEAQGHAVTAVLPPESVWVEADSDRVAQIIDNLLNNAIKYTGRGGTITVTLAKDGRDAVLEVQDTGLGFAPEAAPKLFKLFSQLHAGSKMAMEA